MAGWQVPTHVGELAANMKCWVNTEFGREICPIFTETCPGVCLLLGAAAIGCQYNVAIDRVSLWQVGRCPHEMLVFMWLTQHLEEKFVPSSQELVHLCLLFGVATHQRNVPL